MPFGSHNLLTWWSDFAPCPSIRPNRPASQRYLEAPKRQEGIRLGGLRATAFRIQNFRNVDDSGWIELDRVTALVGRNESGKSALLQALHKFNPAVATKYVPQREYPRDRFQSEYADAKAKSIPVASVRFAIEGDLRKAVEQVAPAGTSPDSITYTRYYDGNLKFTLDPAVKTIAVTGEQVTQALDEFSGAVRRLETTGEGTEKLDTVRGELLTWIGEKRKAIPSGSLRTDAGRAAITAMQSEVEKFSNPTTAAVVESFLKSMRALGNEAAKPEVGQRIEALCKKELPVFIYFEDYGILDSAVYLPRLVEDLTRIPDDAKVRTIKAMFTHVKLTAEEIHQLGQDNVAAVRAQGRAPTPEEIRTEQERKELRAIRLNSASLDITDKFSKWYHQRRHQIRYHADGDYFRIWVSDDKRPGVEIELESRSKGFQWFFSFYLVFLVESEEGHKNAVLLLDEPGLHLHPTAQQELISFFEELSERNQLIYTTHAPFLIDGTHLTRVRTVVETAQGRSSVSSDLWPPDRDTTFPLQAALGYSMMQTLFQGKRNVLVEGLADYFYVHGISLLLRANGRDGLPDDLFVTPCGGTKMVGHLASLFLGQGVRPLVLLDDDQAGRDRATALLKDLYRGEAQSVLVVSDAVKGCAEIEDVIGENALLSALAANGISVKLTDEDRRAGPVVDQVLAWAKRESTPLPEGWKVDAARQVVNGWAAQARGQAPNDLLDRAAQLIAEITKRV